MHCPTILSKLLTPVMHQKRLNTLEQVVGSALDCHHLSVTGLGRQLGTLDTERNGIRKADRFLSNPGLQEEVDDICKELIHLLIGKKPHPGIIIDWTKVPNQAFHILRAALVAKGRAITLYESVHAEKDLGKVSVHQQFLKKFHQLMPEHCQPIIITDAGFGVSWFQQVQALGWHYLGRVRGQKTCRLQHGDEWQKCLSLGEKASLKAKCVGRVLLTKQHAFPTRLAVVRQSNKNRHALTKTGKPRKDSSSKKYSRSATEAWVLVTSLSEKKQSAKKIIAYYKKRMQIEEGIRDLKSTKYGFGFRHMRSYKPHRIRILLLIAMLAAFIAYCVGFITEKNNEHYHYQANSVKNRRVLSLFYLGRRVLKKYQKIHITLEQIKEIFQQDQLIAE